MAKVQTAIFHTDTLWLEHYNPEGTPYKEHFTSPEEIKLVLDSNGYKLTGQNSARRQKIYMRAVAEKVEAAEWA